VSPIIRGAILDADQEAARIMEEARREAQELRERARAEVDALTAATQRELAQRVESATAEARAQAHAEAAALVTQARTAAAHLLGDAQAELRRLAVHMARRILQAELTLRPEALGDLCAAALAEAPANRPVTLHVHPQDLERARARLAPLAHVTLRPAAHVPQGGCIVESELGELDARIDTQLAAFEAALLADLEHRGAPRGSPG
jgi:flagellar biosynthesis/type III secretory pathway protein FliH